MSALSFNALRVVPIGAPLHGEIVAPGDKSVSHRALILATLAKGQSRIEGLLDSADVNATAQACRQLGMTSHPEANALLVEGLGRNGLSAPEEILDMGNSGTAMRLLAGVLAAQPFASILKGDASLSRRPMNRITRPLALMGANISTGPSGRPPLEIASSPHGLKGIDFHSPVASAQVKSCLLLAGLYAAGSTRVCESRLSRDHTERMLRQFGVSVIGDGVPGSASQVCCAVRAGDTLNATEVRVPGDISSAAFFMVAASIVPDSDVLIRNVGLNPTRDGILKVLKGMGAKVHCQATEAGGPELVGDVRIRHCPDLRAMDIPPSWVPSLIDELPAIMVLAARANGVTRIRGAAELRVKESDRLDVMARGLQEMGVAVKAYEDGLDIIGQGSFGQGSVGQGRESMSTTVDASDDHRCAMSFCVLAQVAAGETLIRGAENIPTSYPEFARHMIALGGAAAAVRQEHGK